MTLHLFSIHSNSVDAVNPRSWLGPAYFVEGDFPLARSMHGFRATVDNKIYVFGGVGPLGNWESDRQEGGADGEMTLAVRIK